MLLHEYLMIFYCPLDGEHTNAYRSLSFVLRNPGNSSAEVQKSPDLLASAGVFH